MKVINELPPEWIWKRVQELFTVNPKVTVFTYGDEIYNPGNGNLTNDLIAHENVHTVQQSKIGKDKWWEKYLTSDSFRLSQELEAYQVQYKFYCSIHKDRNSQAKFLDFVATCLSSEIYKVNISKSDAIKKIKQ